MKRLKRILSLLAVLTMLLVADQAVAGQYFSFGVRVGPPPPRREFVHERPGYFWVHGHWGWYPRYHRYHWIGGYWIPARRGHEWHEGGWMHRHHGWDYDEGHWDR